MPEGTLLWHAATEDQQLATVTLVRPSIDGTILVADNVPMDYRGGVAFLLRPGAGSHPTPLLERDDFRQPRCAHFTADGRYLLLGATGPLAEWSLWDVSTAQPRARVHSPYRQLLHARTNASNEVTAHEELEYLDEVLADRGSVLGAISPDGTVLAGSAEPIGDSAILEPAWLSRLVYLWTIDHPEPTAMLEAAEPIDALAFADDGRLLGVATRSGAVEIWEVATARRLIRHVQLRPSRPVTLHGRPLRRGFVVGLEDGTIADAPLDSAPAAPIVTEEPIGDLIVRDDGTLVVSTWNDSRILVVDYATGQRRELAAPPGLAELGTAALTPDGKGLVVATSREARWMRW